MVHWRIFPSQVWSWLHRSISHPLRHLSMNFSKCASLSHQIIITTLLIHSCCTPRCLYDPMIYSSH
jgi:hypothetical protein